MVDKNSSAPRPLTLKDVYRAVNTLNALYREITGVHHGFELQKGKMRTSSPYVLHTHNGQEIILGSAGLDEVLGTLRGIAGGLRLTAPML